MGPPAGWVGVRPRDAPPRFTQQLHASNAQQGSESRARGRRRVENWGR